MPYLTSGAWSGTFDSSGTAVVNAFDAGSASNRGMIVKIQWGGFNNHTIGDTSVTYGATTLTPFGATISQGSGRARAFWAAGIASGSNNLTVDPSAGTGTNDGYVISVIVFDSVDQTTPFDQYTTGQGAAGSPFNAPVTIPSAVGKYIIVSAGAYTNSGVSGLAVSPTGSTYTEVQDAQNSRNVQNIGWADGAASVATTSQITGTALSSTNWVSMGVSVNPSGGSVAYTITADYGAFGPSSETYTLTGLDIALRQGHTSSQKYARGSVRIRTRI